MDDFDRHELKMQKKLEQCPICENCKEHIQDEMYYIIPFWGNICQKCVEECETWQD